MRNARRDRRRKVNIESLEIRQMLAADYLYSLEARPGVPDDGFGFSHAANDQFHVVANFAHYETYHFLEEAPDYESYFYGEIQVHDSTTGDLLRTIQNPMPYGTGGFGDFGGGFNFKLVAPNAFGYSIDVHENLILVGSPGWNSNFAIGHEDLDFETGGRAFLFDANTGNLLHTFDGSFEPVGTQGRNNDGFGRSVAIDGNRIAVGASGPTYTDGESQIWDTDPGRAYVFSATTGNLINIIESPDPSPVETINFGATVSLSDGTLVVTEPGEPLVALSSPGPTRVYDAESGGLLHTLSANGNHQAVIEGNDIVVGVGQSSTHIVNATTGAITQTIAALLYDFDGNLIVAGNIADPAAFLNIHDFPSGDILYAVPAPPDFVEAYWEYNQIPQVFGDRLLVPGRQGPVIENVVFVYSVTDGPNNSPPTDIALSNNSVPENSANGTVVGALTATDPTPSETLTYSMVVSAGGRFAVNGTNLVVADGSLLNFEANTSHSVTVRVTDSAGNTFDKAFTINVSDVNEAATLISLTPNTESENTTNGAVVGLLATDDPDAGDTETYELLGDAGGRFERVGLQIRVANASLLDFETASSHQINVRVTDSAAHVFEQLVTINITDFNFTPTDILLSGNTVPEGAVSIHFNPMQTPGVNFGYDIAASGDRFIVGMNATPATGQVGTATVFSRTTGLVTQTLVSPSAQIGQLFGEHVAIDGDLAVVSARFASGGGAVHVFDVTTGALQRTLTSPLNSSTGFGESVAISGNLIGVGGGAGNDFSVYIFDATDGSLIETLLSPGSASSNNVASELQIVGNSIVVGEPFATVGGVSVGAAYVYQYDLGTDDVTLVTTLNNPSPNASDVFGWSMALSGNTVVVSAPRDDSAATNSGLVYVFDATTGSLLRTISNPTPANDDRFGGALAISGNRLVISADADDAGETDAGAAYVFDLNTGDLLTTILNPLPAADAYFGLAVASAGNTILLSSSGAGVAALIAGAVYRYDLPVAEVVGQLTAVDPESTESFTWQLTDNAGGRFGLDGTNLVVADPTLLNFEDASSHDVVVQVTDSGGLQFSKTFTIQVTDVAENAQFVNGTSGDDIYAVLYSSTDVNSGTVTVQVSTNGGPVTTIGTFPMNQPLLINGLAGTDSVLVLGTSGNDIVAFSTAKNWIINSSTLILSDFETRTLGGGPGNDQYFFDADSPLGAIRLVENAVVGVDRLDFSPTTTVAVSVNMSLNGPQAIHLTNLSLDLPNPDSVENLIGGSMNDDLTGNTVANTITGGPGNDAITGAGGNDSLFGGLGDDKFVFNAVTSAEADYVVEYFNQGTDTITFASMPINVNMSLTTVAVQTVHVDRTVQLNSAITFENLIGGAGNDTLRGNDLNNELTGGPGNDSLYGGNGSDMLTGGLGHDGYFFVTPAAMENDVVTELDGQGPNFLSFATLNTGVSLNLGSAAVQTLHANRTLQLSSGNAIGGVIGSSFDDILTGNSLTNVLTGAGGNDTLNGASGNDSLFGGLGNDTYAFTTATVAELDYVAEMPNEGTDTVDFSAITTPVTYDATISQAQNVHLNRSFAAQLFAVAIENIIGGSGNDILTGNTFANTITGGPGNDTLTAADGNDTLNGGSGNDGLSGGLGNDTYTFTTATVAELDSVAEMPNEGTDTVDFSAITSDVAYDATISQLQNVHLNRMFAAQAFAVAIENMIGGSANDVLTGNTFANTITGGPGNDTLTGADGNDLLYGGTGDDTFVFNAVTVAETDYVAEYFNQGTDTITFASLAINVNFSLTMIAAQAVHTDRTLSLASAITVENLTGGSGHDVLRGNSLDNLLTGNAGGDMLFGGPGSDNLIGGTGDDFYVFVDASASENDTVTELDNQGIDTLQFAGVTAGITMTLASVAAQPVHLNRTIQVSSTNSIEKLYGGNGNDVLTGNALNNWLVGSEGNDTLNGAAGHDLFIGSAGDDTYLFGPVGAAETDSVTEWGNAGSGTDTLDFSLLSDAVTINAGSIAVQNVHLNRTIQLVSAITLENVIGGSGNDELRGNMLANTITGSDGDDRILGVEGNDVLIGGLGNDRYVFATATIAETDSVTELFNQGADSLSFAALTTSVTVDLASDSAQAVHTNRTLQLSSGTTVEIVLGGSASDLLLGNTLPNHLVGNDGDDVLVGREANDILEGGAGRDILIGGLGSDTLSGGDEDDILVAGRTLSDVIIAQLIDLQTEWVSPNTYSTRITNLRAGVGASLASLQAGINVLDDSAAIDTLTGDAGSDWYLRALDDLITDLFAGETIDLL